jgi:hypothetical protein
MLRKTGMLRMDIVGGSEGVCRFSGFSGFSEGFSGVFGVFSATPYHP